MPRKPIAIGGGGSGSSGTVSSGTSPQLAYYSGATTVASIAESSYSSANGTVTWTQKANGNNAVIIKRFTDAAPTGCLLQLQNAAGTALNTCTLDVANNLSVNSVTFSGTFTLNGSTSGSVSEQAPAVTLGNYSFSKYGDRLDYTGIYLADDFMQANSNIPTGDLGWERLQITTCTSVAAVNGVYPNLGLVRLTPSGTVAQGCVLTMGTNAGGSISPFGDMGTNTNWDATWIWRLNRTTVVRYRVGMCGDPSVVEPTNWMGVRFDTNVAYGDTQFTFNVRSSGTNRAISGTTTYAADTNFHRLRMRSTTAGTVLMTLDNNSDATASTSVPTANMTPCMIIVNDNTAAAPTADADYFRIMFTGLNR